MSQRSRASDASGKPQSVWLADGLWDLALVLIVLLVGGGVLAGIGVALFHAFKAVCWAAATALSYVGAIGWWVGLPLASLALLETMSRLRKRDDTAGSPSDSAHPAKKPGRVRPLFCAATAAVLISGNLSLNIAASRIEEHWKSRQQQGVQIYRNHDLARLVGQCVRLAILRHAEQMGNANSPERTALEAIAKVAPAKWNEMTSTDGGKQADPRVLALADAELTEFIREPNARTLHQAEWQSLLTDWRTATGAGAVSDATLAAAAETIAADFGITLREALKADFEKGGKAWAAMQLDIAQQLLNRTPMSAATGNEQINAALAEVQAMLADNAKGLPALHRAVLDVKQSQEAHAKVVAANFDQVVVSLTRIEVTLGRVEKGVDSANEQLGTALQELGVQKRLMGALLRELANGIQIVDFDPSTKATDADKFQAILLLTQPTVISKDAPPPRIELTPEVREFVERMARNASVIDQHRAAVALGDLARADELAERYERERAAHREAEDYAYYVTRGDRFVAAQDFEQAKVNFTKAMAIRVDDPAVVYFAARSTALAPGKANYTQDLQLAQSWVERALAALAKQPDASVFDSARLHATLATTLSDQGKSGASIAPAREALQLLARGKDAPAGQTWAVLVDSAKALQYAGMLREAAAAADRAVAAAEAAAGSKSGAAAITYASRARIRQHSGNLAGAEADIKKSIDLYEAQSPRDERGLAILHADRARIYRDRGDLAKAEADIHKAIDWEESQNQPDHRELAIRYASRASIRQDRGDLDGAEADIQKAIDWGEAQSPRDERGLAIWYNSRATIRQVRGDLAGAADDIQKAIDWFEAQSPRDEHSLAMWYNSRASIRQNRGDLAGAEVDIKKSIDLGEAQSPRDERGLAIRYASRASIRQFRGDLAGAEADIQKAIDWFEAQSPRDERSLAILYASGASIRQDRGMLKEAEDDIAKAIAWGEAQSPRDERSLAVYYASRARILEDQALAAQAAGDAKAAAALFAKAKADIAAALAWWEKNLPYDERALGIFGEDQARIDKAAGGK